MLESIPAENRHGLIQRMLELKKLHADLAKDLAADLLTCGKFHAAAAVMSGTANVLDFLESFVTVEQTHFATEVLGTNVKKAVSDRPAFFLDCKARSVGLSTGNRVGVAFDLQDGQVIRLNVPAEDLHWIYSGVYDSHPSKLCGNPSESVCEPTSDTP